MDQEMFSISWEAEKCLFAGLSNLQQNGDFVDMTIAADDHYVKVHQVVVALASPYLRNLIQTIQKQSNNSHPIIYLNGISQETLAALLEYIYTGEVSVPVAFIKDFAEAGKKLHIKGITNIWSPVETAEEIVEETLPEMEKVNDETMPHMEEYSILHVDNLTDDGQTTETITEEKVIPQTDDTDVSQELHILPDKTKVRQPSPEIAKPTKTTKQPKLVRLAPKPVNIVKFNEVNNGGGDTKSMECPLQYTVSNKGSLQMILNRYVYYAKYTNRKNVRQWRCVDYLSSNIKCPAYVLTRDENVIQRVSAHRHPMHDKRILQKVRSGTVYSSVIEATENCGKHNDIQEKSVIMEIGPGYHLTAPSSPN